MARKKNRPSHDSSSTATAVATAPPAPKTPAPTKGPAVEADFRNTPTGRFLVGLFGTFSSLKLAVVLLSTFTLSLIVATLLESWYSTKIAQDMVYRTKWFALLLVLLACNILCAALKRYPWKRYQIGFLITHSGLLILNFGGLLTALAGTEGLMTMLDSKRAEVERHFGIPNQTSTLLFPDEQKIEFWRLRRGAITNETDSGLIARLIAKDWQTDWLLDHQQIAKYGDVVRRLIASGLKIRKRMDFDAMDADAIRKLMSDSDELREVLRAGALEGEGQQMPFKPGPFTWYSDEHLEPKLPPVLSVLNTLASPLPGFSERLDTRATLTVKNFYSHTEYAPYSKSPDAERGFPALKIAFRSPNMGKTQDEWVAGTPSGEYLLHNVVLVECLVLRDLTLLQEYLHPPTADQMGKQGQLALVIAGKTVRVPVDKDKLGTSLPLGDGFQITLQSYTPNILDAASTDPEYPAVKFELSGPGGKAEQQIIARFPHISHPKGDAGARVAVWYHHPDYRWGHSDLKGVLQFLQTPDALYYRVYGGSGFLDAGQVDLTKMDDPDHYYTAWRAMDLRFRVGEYLPQAVSQHRYVPRNVRPGLDRNDRSDLAPAIRCVLTAQGGQPREFWLREGTTTPEVVHVGGEWYGFRYGMNSRALDFQLRLDKAQRETDPGSDRAASFSSDVVLMYRKKNGEKVEENHHIWMNNPLEHGSYKVYQSGYDILTIDPSNGRPISRSTLQVADDPGLWFKYIGSLVVVLGVVTMFYMKAYFFKPLGRRAALGEEPVAS